MAVAQLSCERQLRVHSFPRRAQRVGLMSFTLLGIYVSEGETCHLANCIFGCSRSTAGHVYMMKEEYVADK